MTHLGGILVEDVNDVWSSVAPYIENALEYSYGEYTIYDIYECLQDRSMQLWIGYEGRHIKYVLITTIERFYSGKKICHVVALAGDGMEEWLESNESELQSWCMENNCVEIRITGRPGWNRVLDKLEYRQLYTVMAKTLPMKH